MATVIFGIGLLLFLALMFTAIFERTRIPDVLALIILGILLGPVTHLVSPQDLGKMGHVMSTVALIIILFESGAALELDVLLKALRPTLSLSMTTFGLTTLVFYLIGFFLLGLTVMMSLILASTLGAVSAVVVIPLVKSLKMREPAATTLVIEAALTDVLSIVLVFALVDSVTSGDIQPGKIVGSIISSLLLAGLIGLFGGVAWLLVLNSVRRFPNTAFATVAYVCILYGIAEFMHFSGAIAALAFGLMLTNHKQMPFMQLEAFHKRELGAFTEADLAFHGELIFLLKTFFFVYLGLSIEFTNVMMALYSILGVVIIYAGRALIVRFSMRETSPGWEESSIMGVMAPKGLASAVLAVIPLERGLAGADVVRNFTYMVVLCSIAATAGLIPLMRHGKVARLCQWMFPTAKGKNKLDAKEEDASIDAAPV